MKRIRPLLHPPALKIPRSVPGEQNALSMLFLGSQAGLWWKISRGHDCVQASISYGTVYTGIHQLWGLCMQASISYWLQL